MLNHQTTTATNQNSKPLGLLASVPEKSYERLVVRFPYQTDADFAQSFHYAAQQLATTFRGVPENDLLLIPFLALYRQAFELQLKNTIRSLVGLRMTYIDGRTPELLAAVTNDRFKGAFGHNLHKLLNEVKKHYESLGLDEALPDSVERLIGKLHEADKSGTAFRYAGLLPDTQENADFPDLSAHLNDEYELLCSVTDYAYGCYDAMPVLDDLADEMY